jgi:hypothetical protein
MLQNSGLGVQLSDFTKDTDDYRFFAKCKVFACLIRMSDFDHRSWRLRSNPK